MKVKIDEKLICIPPHISATWDQITFLQSEEDGETKTFTLILHLSDGKVVKIPELDASVIDIAFSAHIKHMEGRAPAQKGEPQTFGTLLQKLTGMTPEQLTGMPIRFGISGGGLPGMEGFEMAMQHNQEQANGPDIPDEVLEKISGMAKMMSGGDLASFPKPEPHCNCMHCQVARTIHNLPKNEVAEDEGEPVADEELTFRTWDIADAGDQLYTVTNPLNPEEHYSVFLGSPVGCTCGQADCEHIKAVLYS